MLSITYFCRDNSRSGSDSSMQASLRRSKRAGGAGSEREAGSVLWERGASQPPFPWAVVFTVQSENSGLLHGQIGPRESQ